MNFVLLGLNEGSLKWKNGILKKQQYLLTERKLLISHNNCYSDIYFWGIMSYIMNALDGYDTKCEVAGEHDIL